MKIRSLALLLALLPVALFSATPTVSPPPNAIPGGTQLQTFVIKNPGYYYVTGDRTMADTSTTSIEITCNDVTLDLGGYTLRNLGTSGNGCGVYGDKVSNIEVRNGSISTSPQSGIYFVGPSDPGENNIRIIDVRVTMARFGIVLQNINSALIDRCTVDHAIQGISVMGGVATVVSNCVISNTSGDGLTSYSTHGVVKNCVVSDAASFGINLDKSDAVDCQINSCNLSKKSDRAGIQIQESGSIRNCVIRDCYIASISASIGHFVIQGNMLAGTRTAAEAVNGLAVNATYATNVLAKDNTYTLGTGFLGNITAIGNSAF